MTKTIAQQVTVFLLMGASVLFGQAATPASADAPKFGPSPTHIPKHLVYTHFLSMVNDLDKKATDAGDPDPFKFAQPFSRARLENADLDTLREHAKASTRELAAHDQKAKVLIDAYRDRAKAAVQQGLPLPPLPLELHQLQAERTAIMINHMLTLQTKLGKEKTDRLEAYLTREVTPHVSLQVLAHPRADTKTSTTAQSSTFDVQH